MNKLIRITYKRKIDEGSKEQIIERIHCERKSLFKILESVMVHYPESLEDGNYIKIEGVII